jgi:hypothetical protein
MCNNSSLFFMMVYLCSHLRVSTRCTRKHDEHGHKRIRTRFRSGEPAITKHYKTLYYLTIYSVYDVTWYYRSTEYTQFTLLFFASISFLKPTEYLLNLLAMKPRQIEVPEWLAKITCRTQVRLQPADFPCQNQVRFQLAGLTCQSNPSPPLRTPRQDPARHSPPSPPPALHNGGGGGGGKLTRLAHASWTGTFPFIPLTWPIYIFYMTQQYSHPIQSGLMNKSITILLLGEGIIY